MFIIINFFTANNEGQLIISNKQNLKYYRRKKL